MSGIEPLEGFGFLEGGKTRKEYEEMWREFSNIQCAAWIESTYEARSRFNEWARSGNPDDAWS